jgi:predicted  nucleic acid-binding Zn-ribbon protein
MAYPIILLFKQVFEKRDHWKVNLITRGVVIVLSFLFTIFWLTAIVRLDGGAESNTPVRETYAGSLWSVPILGPFVFTVAAVVLQALAAYLLVRYASENPELKADKLALPSLEANLVQAESDVTFAEAKVRPRQTRVDDLKKEIDDLTPKKDKAVKALDKAKGKFDANKVVARRKVIATKLEENKTKRAATLSDFEQKNALAKSAKGAAKGEYHNEAARLDAELTQLQTEQTALETELTQLDDQVKQVRKQLGLKSLEKAVDTLGAELKKKGEKLEKATKRLETATTAFADASATRDKIKTERDDTQARIDEATKALKNALHDVALTAGLAAACLFLAFVVFDASWYGWKLIA